MEGQRLLERILDGAEDPTDLPFTLLQDITDNFSEERKIGQGGFASVYKGVLGERIVAVKRIHINVHTVDDKLFHREATSLMNSNHRNVVRFLGFCSQGYQKSIDQDGSGKYIWANVLERLLCFEYISNGSLHMHITDELRGLEWEARYEIITGICKGLRYLHMERGIIHMDLKPENILLDHHDGKYMVPKITDFGLSRPNENSHTTGKSYGTRGYWAPEYMEHSKTTPACDVYSLGLIIIELVTGRKDIPEKHNVLRRWRHRWSKPPTQLWHQQVTRCMEIAGRCRAEKPEARPSISKIINFLSESESTNGPIIPCLDEDDMLHINPLELLPSEQKNDISHSVKLTNNTLNCIAFNIQQPSAQPVYGIVQPRSTYVVTITVQARDVREHDHAGKFIVQSMKWTEGLGQEDITKCMSRAEARKFVDEVEVMVVYETTKPQENCKRRGDINMLAEDVPEAKKREIGESSSRKGKNAEEISMDISSSNLHPLQSFSLHYPTETKYLEKESDRAVDHARGALGSLLHKLGKFVTEDYSLETSVSTYIKSLSEDLTTILQDLPDLENVKGAKIWFNDVRELSYHIEDMVDSFLVHVEPNSNGIGFRELPNEGLKLWENGMMTHHHITDVISDIKKQVHDLAEKKKKYNLNVNNVVANATEKTAIQNLRNSAITIGIEQLIGIEKPKDEIIKLFEENGDISKQNLKIVSIVGLGGLGKTTLANAVYEKLQQTENYTSVFVPVGRNPLVNEVLMEIISELEKGFNEPNWMVWRLCLKLQQLLQNKRYLIVIDDLWESSDWKLIKSAFPDNKCGSRIITTTRSKDVALACCNLRYVYMIKQLSEEDSKNLFFRRTRRLEKDCPDRLKYISVQILKTCRGMPLAINSIASLLADKDDTTWEYVWNSLGAMAEGNNGLENVTKILDLSYIHLPDYLKTCLLYVCMYPEDREIKKKDTLRQWVAEGFVHVSTNSRLDAEDVAEHYFQQLVTMCMIQPEKIDNYNNEVLSCKVHDIIFDLMRSKSTEVNFIHVIDGPKGKAWPGQIHRVSVLHGKENVRNLETIRKGALKHVRSVLLQQGSLVPYFLLFKYIRVLHLEDKEYALVPRDLTGISQLLLLRYLKVACTSFELPNQIGELQQLETIDLDGRPHVHGELKKYPSDIVTLSRLSHLRYARGMVLPDGIGRLKSLRTLEGVCVFASTLENIKDLGELTNLRVLQLSFQFRLSERTNINVDALHSSISKLSTSLRIFNLGEEAGVLVNIQSWSRTLFPPGSCIRELNLSKGCNLQRCPKWIGQLPDLYSLSIRVEEVANGFSIAGRLPSLAYFNLKVDKPPREEKEESVVISGFKALKHLIFHCTKVKLTFGAKALPKLEKLELIFCYHMTPQLLPDGIEHLPAGTLKEILLRVDYNDEMPADIQDRADYLRSGMYFEDLMQHKIVVRPLLKMAFERHHPDADIVVFFEDETQEYADYPASEENGSQTSAQFQANTRQLVDDEGVEEEDHYYYGEEADEGAYQVYGSQTTTQIQDNTRQSVELFEAHKDSGRMSINIVAPLTVNTSLHLAVGSEGRQSCRTQDSAVWESSQLPCTRFLSPSPSSIHLTLALCSSPDRAEPLANFPDNAVRQLLDLNQAPSAGLPDLNQAPLDEATNANSSS